MTASAGAWGVLWHSKNRLDGVREYLMCDRHCMPALFHTRREARKWINERCGYIRHRADLRGEPFGWRMPRPVRVSVRAI